MCAITPCWCHRQAKNTALDAAVAAAQEREAQAQRQAVQWQEAHSSAQQALDAASAESLASAEAQHEAEVWAT